MREKTAYWFIMIVLLLILFLLGATLNIRAQEIWEFWYRTDAQPYGVMMVSGDGQATTMEGSAFASTTEFGAAATDCRMAVYVRAEIYADYVFVTELNQCERPPRQDSQVEATGVECLGVPYSGEGFFTVDGNAYRFDQHLSFVVPLDALWRWELRINDQLILVFEQTERGNCRITEDYRP